MKKNILWGSLVGLTAVFIFSLVLTNEGFTRDKGRQFTKIKIGYVNFEKAFNEYYKTKEGNAILAKEKSAKEDEGRKLVDQVNKMRKEAELLSQEAKKEKEDEIREKIRELKEFTEISRNGLVQKRNEMWKDIFAEIRKVIEKKAEDEEFTVIFDDKALLYKMDGLDLTDEIISELNKEGKKG